MKMALQLCLTHTYFFYLIIGKPVDNSKYSKQTVQADYSFTVCFIQKFGLKELEYILQDPAEAVRLSANWFSMYPFDD